MNRKPALLVAENGRGCPLSHVTLARLVREKHDQKGGLTIDGHLLDARYRCLVVALNALASKQFRDHWATRLMLLDLVPPLPQRAAVAAATIDVAAMVQILKQCRSNGWRENCACLECRRDIDLDSRCFRHFLVKIIFESVGEIGHRRFYGVHAK
jgi:hypothetical protein